MLNSDALALMKKTAKKLGYTVKANSRSDWSVYSNGHWRGIIVVIESQFKQGSPYAVASRHCNYPELSELRHAMNTALAEAGFLEFAENG